MSALSSWVKPYGLRERRRGNGRFTGRRLHSPYCMLSGENISARFVVPTVAASVDLVVHLGIDTHGVRRVNEIVAVPGRVENDIIETESIFARAGSDLVRQSGMPPRPERYDRVGIDVHRLLTGAA